MFSDSVCMNKALNEMLSRVEFVLPTYMLNFCSFAESSFAHLSPPDL